MATEPNQRTVIIEDESLKQFDGGFTSIPNRILASNSLSLGARMCYAMLLKYAWQTDFCFPAQQRLAEDLGVTDRSVRTFLKELRTKGLIDWKQRGLNQPNVYSILKLPDRVKPTDTDPSSESNSAASNPGPENISGPGRKRTSGQERKQASTYKDTENNTHPNNVNVRKISSDQTSRPAKPPGRINHPALKRTYGFTDEQIGRVEYLVDQQAQYLGARERNLRNYVKRAAEALSDHLDGQLEMALRDFDDAAKAMKNPPRIRPAYFQAVWDHLADGIRQVRERPDEPAQKPTIRSSKPGLQSIFDDVWGRAAALGIKTPNSPTQVELPTMNSTESLDPVERHRRLILERLVSKGYRVPANLFEARLEEIMAWQETQPEPVR